MAFWTACVSCSSFLLGHALRCGFDDVADLLDLAAREICGVADDRRVSKGCVVLAADDLRGDIGL